MVCPHLQNVQEGEEHHHTTPPGPDEAGKMAIGEKTVSFAERGMMRFCALDFTGTVATSFATCQRIQVLFE
ncbi:MAG: hypothetical protein D8M59_13960 [Planctomycetes bacterium]|nr:hypothetical protein [Planctomycetota bacterium]